MANPDAAFGLRPVKMIDGSPYNGQSITCHVPATDATLLGIGDPVKFAGSSGSVDGVNNFPTVTRAAAGDAIMGVMVGNHVTKHDDTIHRAASEARDIRVCPARGVVFHCQEDSVGSNLAATDVGNTCDLVIANADTTLGVSRVELDSSNIGTGGGIQVLRLPDVVRNGDKNAVGTNAVWEVRINESQLEGTVTGV
jgi:hypothetical protein